MRLYALLLGTLGSLAISCNAELIYGEVADGAVLDTGRSVASDGALSDMAPLDGRLSDVIAMDAGPPEGILSDMNGIDEADGALLDTPFLDPPTDSPTVDAALLDAFVADGHDEGVPISGCTTAPELMGIPGVAYPGTTAGSMESLSSCPGTSPQGGPVQWYEISESYVQVTVTATSGAEAGNPLVRFYDECPPLSCVANTTNSRGWATVQGEYTPSERRPFYVAVSSDRAGAPSDLTFLIGFRQRLGTSPMNGVCSSATRVNNGDILHHQDLEDAADPSACGSGRIAALHYVVTVPSGQTVVLTASNDDLSGAGDPPVPGMYLSSGCSAAMCPAMGMATGDPGQARLQWTNTQGTAQDMILAIDSGNEHVYPFTFELVVSVQPPGG